MIYDSSGRVHILLTPPTGIEKKVKTILKTKTDLQTIKTKDYVYNWRKQEKQRF